MPTNNSAACVVCKCAYRRSVAEHGRGGGEARIQAADAPGKAARACVAIARAGQGKRWGANVP